MSDPQDQNRYGEPVKAWPTCPDCESTGWFGTCPHTEVSSLSNEQNTGSGAGVQAQGQACSYCKGTGEADTSGFGDIEPCEECGGTGRQENERGSADSVASGSQARNMPHRPGSQPGDWPEDFSHENGNYMRRCCHCDALFYGHKRRVICNVCSTNSVKGASKLLEGRNSQHVLKAEGESPDATDRENCVNASPDGGPMGVGQAAAAAPAGAGVPPVSQTSDGTQK